MTRSVVRRGVDLTVQANDASEQAAADAAKRGLTLPPKPVVEMPIMPGATGLTDLDDADLMNVFSELVAWADYAAGQLSIAAIDERAIAQSLEFSEATAMVRWGGDEKVTFARAQRDLDAGVQELKQALISAYALRKITETITNNLERDASLVSRELTRRTSGQAPIQRRANRWQP